MTCSKCSSERVLSVSAKTSDRFSCNLGTDDEDYDYLGYVPEDLNLGGGDYLSLDVCLDCGQLQGDWPVSKPEFKVSLEDASS